MKIANIKKINKNYVYDISVEKENHYVLENGVVSHNTGIYYSADNVLIIGRQQDKEGKELLGFNFVIDADKSRFVKEHSKFPINVKFDKGIAKWSGMIELAVELGVVEKRNRGRLGNAYYIKGDEETAYEKDAIETDEFWDKVFTQTEFKKLAEERYKL